MGAKIGLAYVLVCLLAGLGQFVSTFVRWHMLSLGGGLIATMHTTLLSSKMTSGLAVLCGVVRKWEKCKNLREGMWLQDLQVDTCQPFVASLSSVPCDAFKAAYLTGILSLLCFLINWILMCASCGMLQRYLHGKHKPEYRTWSFALLCIGSLLVFLALMTWSFVTLPALDGTAELFSLCWGGVPFGASYGYFFMWFSFVFQLVAMLMHYWMPLDNEMTEDDRLESKMRKEYNQHASQGYGAAGYAYQGQAGYGAPGYGAPSYGQGYGYGAPAPPNPGMPQNWGGASHMQG